MKGLSVFVVCDVQSLYSAPYLRPEFSRSTDETWDSVSKIVSTEGFFLKSSLLAFAGVDSLANTVFEALLESRHSMATLTGCSALFCF